MKTAANIIVANNKDMWNGLLLAKSNGQQPCPPWGKTCNGGGIEETYVQR